MNIIVLLWGALGDMLVATPALRALRERHRDARITFVTNAIMPQIAPEGTLADEIIICTPEELASVAFTMRLGRRLARVRADLAINLRYTSERSALLTWLSRARSRVGAGPRSWMWCYNRPLAYPRSHYNELFRYRDMMEAIDIPVTDLKPFVYVSADHSSIAAETLAARQMAPGSYVCMHPGASKPYRAWLPERYAEIGRRIVQQHGSPVLVTWADHEKEIAERVVREIGAGASLAPRTPSIGHLAALFAQSMMVICNNSGAMHVAVAADAPVVALTGATELEDWAPVGDKHRSVKSPLGGLPDSPESERRIMDALPVETVWDAVHTRMNELRGAR